MGFLVLNQIGDNEVAPSLFQIGLSLTTISLDAM